MKYLWTNIWQKKQFEDVTLDFWKLRWPFFHNFLTLYWIINLYRNYQMLKIIGSCSPNWLILKSGCSKTKPLLSSFMHRVCNCRMKCILTCQSVCRLCIVRVQFATFYSWESSTELCRNHLLCYWEILKINISICFFYWLKHSYDKKEMILEQFTVNRRNWEGSFFKILI